MPKELPSEPDEDLPHSLVDSSSAGANADVGHMRDVSDVFSETSSDESEGGRGYAPIITDLASVQRIAHGSSKVERARRWP